MGNVMQWGKCHEGEICIEGDPRTLGMGSVDGVVRGDHELHQNLIQVRGKKWTVHGRG